MLGNDVVDLRDPDTRPETFRARFDERVFAPAERRLMSRVADSHTRRWLHWAAKEAAYKLAKQVDPDFVFAPSKLVPRFGRAAADDEGVCHGTLELPRAASPGLQSLELRGDVTVDRVHVLAVPRGADWESVVLRVERVEEESRAGTEVRRIARERIARDLGIEPHRVSIGRRGRIPTVEIDGTRSTMAISLSHHGGWVACAVGLSTEGTLEQAGRGVGLEGTRGFETARRWV